MVVFGDDNVSRVKVRVREAMEIQIEECFEDLTTIFGDGNHVERFAAGRGEVLLEMLRFGCDLLFLHVRRNV